MQTITKGDIIEFFNKHLNPVSKARSKLSIHLLASGGLGPDEKIDSLAVDLGLGEADAHILKAGLVEARRRPGLKGLKNLLARELPSLTSLQLRKILEVGHETASVHVNGTSKDDDATVCASTERVHPVFIGDVRLYKAGLMVSAGARPVKDLSEFEEIDAKL